MRNFFRSFLARQNARDRALFMVPIAVALFLVLIFVQEGASVAATWRDPLSVLSQRSPGERGHALYNTKPKREVVALVPQERVLPVTRARPLPAAPLPETAPIDLVFPDQPIIPQAPGLLAMDTPIIPEFVRNRTNTNTGCCTNNIVPGLVPVPEPTTWLMNILGIAAVGAAMRYRNRRLKSGRALPARA